MSPCKLPDASGPKVKVISDGTAPFAAAAARGPEQRYAREPGPPQLQEPLPAHTAPARYGPSSL